MFIVIGSDGKEYGPISREQVLQWQAEGRLNGRSRIRATDQTEWKTLAEFPEFAAGPAPQTGFQPLAPQHADPPKVNSLAITSLVLGILSMTLGLCCCSGLPFSISGIIFGSVAFSQIKNSSGREGGKNIAIAGLICSIAGLLVGISLTILGLAMNLGEVLKNMK